MRRDDFNRCIAQLDPYERISELEHENAMLRFQRDREILDVAKRELGVDIKAAR